MSEQWKDIIGYEGLYKVSNMGRIYSIRNNRFLVQSTTRGALTVGLSNGKSKTFAVHRLVAGAFLGPQPVGLHTCHNDGDFMNNVVTNLRYDTPSGNAKDKLRHGTHHEANKTHCIRGHEFNHQNTYVDSVGKRKCRPCKNIRRKGEPLV